MNERLERMLADDYAQHDSDEVDDDAEEQLGDEDEEEWISDEDESGGGGCPAGAVHNCRC
jgi:hypothetical protein